MTHEEPDMRERCEKEDLGLTEEEYREAAQDICSKPSDYLFIWVKDHLKEFHRVDALRKDLQEKLKAVEAERRIDALDGQAQFDEMGNQIESLTSQLKIANGHIVNLVGSKKVCNEPCSCCNYYEKQAKQFLQKISEVV